MKLFVFGNGSINFSDYIDFYLHHLNTLNNIRKVEFVVCDFCGVDTLTMEFLKTRSSKVSIYHIAERPRYLPARYRTKVTSWKLIGGFSCDEERDNAAIDACTHFLALDFNSTAQRESGTKKNINRCIVMKKIPLAT
ncbi:hypothetical protein [Candidatus Uabimicrobium sp. HlEnr_7]|uniref:hypothetical protein n=1 Tax=Candidatus Uabimicrobium helgolandensis TaxID=3095367 RepID=UPI003558C108